MLKTIEVPGYGPYVCGRLKSKYADDVQKFSALETGSAFGQTFADALMLSEPPPKAGLAHLWRG